MKPRLWIPLAVLIVFGLYTGVVVAREGYLGFLSLAAGSAWGGQVFVDLVIALGLFLVWMVRDAREQEIPAWPYAVAVLLTGSIGALAYLVHRGAKPVDAPVARPA